MSFLLLRLPLALGLQGGDGLGIVVPVSLPLVDEPVVYLLQLQPCLLHEFRLVIFLERSMYVRHVYC